jgi:hypothetical protein
MSEKRLNEELTAVEAALASLKPAASSVDRDRMMYLAGRMSAVTNTPPHKKHKTHWLWPCVTAVSLLLAIASSGMLFVRGTAIGEKEAAYAKSNNTQTMGNNPHPLWYEHTQKESHEAKLIRPRPTSGRGNIPTDYLSLSMLVAEKGVEALPSPSWIPIGPEKYPHRDLMMQDERKMF